MTTHWPGVLCPLLISLAIGCAGNAEATAATTEPTKEQVELFAAMHAQQLDVKFVPKDARQATVMIRNKTDRPLSIQLPAAFAGMPVLGQNAGGNNAGGNNNSSNTSSNQSVGGGMMGGGMMGGMGGGFFDIGPDRVAKLKVTTVCLEHGKQDPNPRVAYELRPIEQFTDNRAVIEVCTMLGRGQLDQSTAQAAAWHLTDGLSWQELAQKVRVKHLNGSSELYFTSQQLNSAVRAVHVAYQQVAQQTEQLEANSPGEQLD